MDVNSVVVRISTPDFTHLDGSYLAIDAPKGCCYGLNGTAHVVWTMLDRPIRVSDLCARLAQRYNVDEETCQRDTVALLTDLRSAGLLEIHPQTQEDN
ncbi:MAG: PqqD family protein [Capsulimonadaceae bacterium]